MFFPTLDQRTEVRYALSINDSARLERVTLTDAQAVDAAEYFHVETEELSYCAVCQRFTDHRGEHLDWQYIASSIRLI